MSGIIARHLNRTPSKPFVNQINPSSADLVISEDSMAGDNGQLNMQPTHSERMLFQKNLFVGRFKELQTISSYVEQAKTGALTRPTVEFAGPASLGKTWFLCYLREYFSAEKAKADQASERQTFTTYIDLAQLNEWKGREYWLYYYFLHIFFAAIPEQVGSQPSVFSQVQEPHPQIPLAPDQLRALVAEFQKWLNDILSKWVPIILLDSTEQADPLLLDWIDESILAPLARTRRGLIIVAGRHPAIWREPDVRLNLDLQELEPLTDEEDVWSRQPIEYQAHPMPIPRVIHDRYALGHPGVAAAMYRQLLQTDFPVTVETLGNLDEITPTVKTLINTVVQDSLLEDVRADLIPLLRSVCTLRVFSTSSLQEFAREFASPDESYATKPRAFFNTAITEMKRNNVVKWSASLSDHTIIPAIRRVLANMVHATAGRANFERRHAMAYAMYLKRLETEATTAPWSVPELLYHRAVLSSLISPHAVSENVLQELETLLAKDSFTRTPQSVDKLLTRLKNPQADIDLAELHQDMLTLIQPTDFDAIIRIVEKFAQRFNSED